MPGKVVARSEWVKARKALLVKEKELQRARDALSAERRELPMVRITEDYAFRGPKNASLTLSELFGDKQQLVVYHFMFGPGAEDGCCGCAFAAQHVPCMEYLHARNTALAVVSRAPIKKLESFRKRRGWGFPWFSSNGPNFNYDFHVTLDESVAPVEYNYRTKAEMEERGHTWQTSGEQAGISVFFKKEGEVFHTYSTYARGLEAVMGTYGVLDMTPLGRQDQPMGAAAFKYAYGCAEGM